MKLSNDLKKMLSGLAYQNAGEALSMREKLSVLGYDTESEDKTSAPKLSVAGKPATKRIALISDGRGLGAPLDYAIETCSRQNAKIDLLVHDLVDTANISALEYQIREAGLDCQRIHLGVNTIDDLVHYICNHPSLIFLVAMPDDAVAKILVEDVIPKRGGRIHVPMVLIEDRSSVVSTTKRSVA